MTGIKRVHAGFGHESTINESVEWYTPREIFDSLGLTFDLDPCSPGAGKSFVPARRHLTVVDDGLTSDWGDGLVFVNPPYGKQTAEWMEKFARHRNGIALVFARTDTRWFTQVADADAICFVSSRIRFYKGSIAERGGSPGAGSMLVAYGAVAAEAVLRSGLGHCFRQLQAA